MNETWKAVPGYEGLYEVSSLGRVKSLARECRAMRKGTMASVPIPERMLTPTQISVGYLTVGLSRDGNCKTKYIHQLVCEAWNGPRPEGFDAAHFDGDKHNNTPENLRWASRRDNVKDKVRHGRQPRGDDLWFTKISDEQVRLIRSNAHVTAKAWADKLGVAHQTISAIRRGEERVHAGAL
jgi:hypothetical protein